MEREVASVVLILLFGGACVACAVWAIARLSLREWIPLIAGTAALMGSFFLFGALAWFPDSAWDRDWNRRLESPPLYVFCEGYVDGWIAQPIGVWTDLAFVLSGLAVPLVASLRSGRSNPMLRPESGVPVAYALTLVFMGPGSMYYHASLKDWAGWCDWFSIINWAAFGLGYNCVRMLRPVSGNAIWPLWVIWGVAAAAAGIGGLDADHRDLVRWIVIPSWVATELVILAAQWIRSPAPSPFGIARDGWWFLGAVCVFFAAFAIWMPSGAVWRVWCDPDWWFQGHGVWHVLAALGTWLVFWFWSTEIEQEHRVDRVVPSAPARG